MSATQTSAQQSNTPDAATPQLSTTTSKVPLLGEGFHETTSKSVSKSTSDAEGAVGDTAEGAKSGKRRLFGFGRKKTDDKDKLKDKKKEEETLDKTDSNVTTPIGTPLASRDFSKQSSPPSNHPYNLPTSPHRNLFSTSPRIVSPAGSQIFERDVQESAVPVPNSPAIPSHIQTENHIPSVLDASSEAITNSQIDPDSVEIVMHTSHQPAAAAVTGATTEPGSFFGDELATLPEKEESTSNYATLDNSDVRRLSFISFSDIVQSEHAEHAGSRDSIYVAGLSSLSSAHNRSPSPIRSLGTSPPTSGSPSVKGVEMSPRSKPLGSPTLSTHPLPLTTGELTIETMTQALRRTASGDLSGVRSQPLSPSSPTEGTFEQSIK